MDRRHGPRCQRLSRVLRHQIPRSSFKFHPHPPPPNPGLSRYQLQVSNPPFRNITQLSLATVINHFTVTKTKGVFLLDCCKSLGLETSGSINFFLVEDVYNTLCTDIFCFFASSLQEA